MNTIFTDNRFILIYLEACENTLLISNELMLLNQECDATTVEMRFIDHYLNK